ncbi:MAG: peptide chain release factor 1 [Actinobacteria bacterium]|nr:MAG: peptide chain release factor 1 [Actinomycetota bacterium]
MQDKLEQKEQEYKELNNKLSDPAIIADQKQYAKLARAHCELEKIVNKIKKRRVLCSDISDASSLLKEEKDVEMRQYLESELAENKDKLAALDEELESLMLPKDPDDDKDIIVEIRAGAGGNEAALFAADLYRMYSRYCERQGYKVEPMSSSSIGIGGLKEVIFEVIGHGAYRHFKYESGVHRVQRIPVTESGGRIHTSTITVAVLPEVEEVEVEIDPNDLQIDVFRSSGPGGQSVNTTDSAVRVTHKPTSIVVSCQDEKSQLQNKVKALKILRARLYEQMLEEQQSEQSEARRVQVGTGDRSEKIRTYNFPQNRITDHRIGFSSHNLEAVLDGQLDEFIKTLSEADKKARLESKST